MHEAVRDSVENICRANFVVRNEKIPAQYVWRAQQLIQELFGKEEKDTWMQKQTKRDWMCYEEVRIHASS